MADDFLGIPTDAAADVPAEIQSDGAVTENFTGEQVADEAGNASWWDETYPGQTTTSADSPTQDAYGLSILNAAQTQELTRNINPAFINSLNDPSIAPPVVINRLTGRPIESPVPYGNLTPDQQANRDARLAEEEASRVQNLDPNYWANKRQPPAVSSTPIAQTFTNAVNKTATPIDTGAGAAVAADNQQIAAAAARLNAQSPNPYLTNIDQAAAEISRGQDGIATSTKNIQTAQQYIVDAESYIAQNNAELADPDISAERRAVLEANNAENAQIIFDSNQNITNQETYIITQTETNQFNEGVIDANSAGYRVTTAGSDVPVVDVNSDPSFVGPQQITATVINPTTSAAPVDTNQSGEGFGNVFPDGFGGFVNGDGQPVDDNGLLVPTGNNVTQSAAPVDTNQSGEGFGNVFPDGFGGFVNGDGQPVDDNGLLLPTGTSNTTAAEASAIQTQVGRQLAQQQAVNAAQKKSVNNGDWRVRLSLAPGARYLYNAPDPGILDPLTATDGVIFPYTPSIDMAYKADYDQYALTHSNYKGYFYKSSSTEAVQMKATFTAQDSAEANYLLAVIHFFRSVTKMFYGQDPQRGAPPPLVYLTGLGQYQFATHPCVVTSFSYQLPDSVDYIRARSTNINGTNLLTRRVRQDLPTNPISGAVGRLANLFSGQGISYGAEICRPPPPTLGQNQPTYVPTKMDINLTLLPVQSRRQVSQQFSLRGYANGDLLKRGFW
jgi:hypothetical protein